MAAGAANYRLAPGSSEASVSMTDLRVSSGVVHEVPDDLRAALASDAGSLAAWEDISPLARNEWICWVQSVKKAETRAHHVARAREELKEGKRRPCCWPGCPHREEKAAMTRHKIYTMAFAKVYPLYIAKVDRKGRTKAEVDQVILWLTGYSQAEVDAHLAKGTDFETFFAEAPRLNPARGEIKGLICGIRVEEIAEPLMREIRYMDKLVDELAKGRAMEKILRGEVQASA
jgi:hypothetical protein